MSNTELNLKRLVALNDLGIRVVIGAIPRLPIELAIDEDSQLSRSRAASSILSDGHANLSTMLDSVDRVLALEGEPTLIKLHESSLKRLSRTGEDFIE